jgi:hypothetical protein
MALTFSQLTDEVLFNAFAGTDFTMRAQRFLNEAVNEIGRRVGFMLKAYEVGTFDQTGIATLTRSFFRVEEVWLCNGPTGLTSKSVAVSAQRRLLPAGSDSEVTSTISAGYPVAFQTEYVPADRPSILLRVFPSNQTGFVGVVGRALPAKMTAPTDTSGLGGEWDDALISFARSRCFRTEDDFQAAQTWMAEFEQHLHIMARARTPTQDGPIVTPGPWEDGAAVSGGA